MLRIRARTIMAGLLCFIISTPAIGANETHIFLGKRTKAIPPKWCEGGKLPVTIGNGYIATGYKADKIRVDFLGRQVSFETHGVWLSKPSDSQPPHKNDSGTIRIWVPHGVGVIEIVYRDNSANLPLVNGCDLTVDASSNRRSRTLEVQMGGDPAKRRRIVKQFFRPVMSGQKSSVETEIKLKAYGYDEFRIRRITLYSHYDFDAKTNFITDTKGTKTEVQLTSRTPETELYEKLVWQPLKRHAASKPKPASVSQLISELNQLRPHPELQGTSAYRAIMSIVKEDTKKWSRELIGFYGVTLGTKHKINTFNAFYSYRRKNQEEVRYIMKIFYKKDDQWKQDVEAISVTKKGYLQSYLKKEIYKAENEMKHRR